MNLRLWTCRQWLSLLLAVVVAIPAVSGIASQSVYAVSPPENPAFTVDNVSGGRTLQLAFTPVSGIDYYRVYGYTSRDNYDSVQFVQSNYQPGQELGSGANDLIAYSIGANPMKFAIQGFDSSGNPVTSYSPKSIPYFSTEGASFQLSSPTEISTSAIRVPFTPKTGQSSMTVRLFRSDNYSQIFREVTGITAGGKDIEVPGNYSYRYQYRFVGSTINSIAYLTSHWRDNNNQTIRVPAHPNPPSNIRVTGGNQSVSVSFDPPQPVTGADIFQYGVSYSTDKISWTNFYTNDTTWTTSSLTNGQPYWIKVKTVAVGGAIGEWVTPTPVIPSFTPLIPALTLLAGNERIDANWLAPSSDGGAPVLSYLLQYSTDGSNWTDITLDSTKRTHSITGLVNGTQYTVRIYARNNSGLSATNQTAIRATPVGSPIPQTAAVSKIDTTRATIGMSVDSKGNTLTPFLQYGPAGNYNSTISGTAAKGDNLTFTYDITGLTPGYLYQARSGVRIGTIPTNGTELTFITTPNAPTGLSATMTGTTAAVTWDYFSPNHGGTKYHVWAEQNGIEVGNRCTAFVNGGNNCEITGLTPGKNYVIKATARATGANFGNGTSVAANLNVATLAPQTILFSFGSLPRKGSQSISSSFDASSFASTSSGLQATLESQTTAKCDVTGTVVTILRSGTCTIRASQNGNSKYIAATSVDASFVIASTQTITFSVSSIGTQTFGGSTLNVSSLASATSDLTVSFTSTTPYICTVSDTTVTYVGAGKCRVVASQEGDENYDPAVNIAREITVNKGTQSTLTVSSTTGTYGTELILTTSGGSGTGIVSYAIDTNANSATCSITSEGLISTSAGECAVIATKADDVNYLSKTSASTLITLQKAAQSIAFTPIAGSGTLLQGGTIAASARASSGLTVTISSDTESKCTVLGTTVTLVADGICTLRGTQSGNSNFNAATAVTTSFEISPKPIPETSPIVYPRLQSPDTYRVGDVVALSIAPTTYQDSIIPGTYEFIPTIPGSVSFGDVTIDADGTTHTTAYFMKAHLAFLLYAVFTPTDTANFAQAQTFSSIMVNAKPQNIVVNDDISEYNQTRSITFNGIESTGQVSIDLSPTTPQGQSVFEDQRNHCTVSKRTVTRDNPGYCYVRINAMGDGEFESSLGIGTFYFTKLSQNIVMTNTDQLDSLTAENIGDTIDLESIATSSSTLTVTVTSRTTSICTVSTLTLTVLSAGTCEITVQQSGNDTYSAASDFIYSFNILGLEQASISLTSTSTVFGTPLTLTASGGSGTGEFSFVAIDGLATGCSVQNGTLVSTSSGSCLVSVTRASDSSYLSKSTTPILVEITRAAQSIQTDVSSIQTVQIGNAPIDLSSFVATSSGSSVSLRVNDERICSLDGSVLTLLELGTCSFTASQDGTDNFEPATEVVVTLSVTPYVEPAVIALPEKTTTSNTAVTKAQLKAPSVPATVTTSRILKFTMKTSSGTPLTVSASGACKVSKVTKVVTTRVKVKGKMALKKSTLQTGWSLSFPKRGKCRATFRSIGNQYFFPLAATKTIRVK